MTICQKFYVEKCNNRAIIGYAQEYNRNIAAFVAWQIIYTFEIQLRRS